MHENDTRKSAGLGQLFPGHLIQESPGMPLSQSCRRSHSKAVPTPRGPAGVWFYFSQSLWAPEGKFPVFICMASLACLQSRPRMGRKTVRLKITAQQSKKVKFQESKIWLANQRWGPGIPATFSFRLLWKSGLILPGKRMKTFLEPQKEEVSSQTYCLISSVFTWPGCVFLVSHIHLWLQWTKN